MPQYSFINEKTGEVKDVFMSMNDDHRYVDENGLEWTRVWHVPQASMDVSIDPFDKNKFVEKTKNTKDSVGALWDRSAELSQKRSDKRDGVDPLKKRYFDNYSKKCKGKKHMRQIREEASKINITI